MKVRSSIPGVLFGREWQGDSWRTASSFRTAIWTRGCKSELSRIVETCLTRWTRRVANLSETR